MFLIWVWVQFRTSVFVCFSSKVDSENHFSTPKMNDFSPTFLPSKNYALLETLHSNKTGFVPKFCGLFAKLKICWPAIVSLWTDLYKIETLKILPDNWKNNPIVIGFRTIVSILWEMIFDLKSFEFFWESPFNVFIMFKSWLKNFSMRKHSTALRSAIAIYHRGQKLQMSTVPDFQSQRSFTLRSCYPSNEQQKGQKLLSHGLSPYSISHFSRSAG